MLDLWCFEIWSLAAQILLNVFCVKQVGFEDTSIQAVGRATVVKIVGHLLEKKEDHFIVMFYEWSTTLSQRSGRGRRL